MVTDAVVVQRAVVGTPVVVVAAVASVIVVMPPYEAIGAAIEMRA